MHWSAPLLVLATAAIACDDTLPVDTDCSADLEGGFFVGPRDECGLCECGEALCNWTVSFDGGWMYWSYSDLASSHEFTCEDGKILDARAGDLLALYNAREETVLLDGRTYRRCEGACEVGPGSCPVCPSSPCGDLDGMAFRTVERHECGPCEGGAVAECHWMLQFNDGLFEWARSDVSEFGTYICDSAGNITAYTTREITGSVDEETGLLSWDGITYEPCSGACDPELVPCE